MAGTVRCHGPEPGAIRAALCMTLQEIALARVGDRSEPAVEFAGEQAGETAFPRRHTAARRETLAQDSEVIAQRHRIEAGRCVVQHT